MAFDVFISHSSKDKVVADATCAFLESRGIRCWIAPRDILPGSTWGGSIIEAIHGARVMLLIFSSHANTSQQVKREVERAVNAGATIIPMRIEDVMPEGDLEYFLGVPHWLDVFNAPLETHLDALANAITEILEIPAPASQGTATENMPGQAREAAGQLGSKTGTVLPGAIRRTNKPSKPSGRGWLIGLGFAIAVLLLGGLVYSLETATREKQELQDQIARQKAETEAAAAQAEKQKADEAAAKAEAAAKSAEEQAAAQVKADAEAQAKAEADEKAAAAAAQAAFEKQQQEAQAAAMAAQKAQQEADAKAAAEKEEAAQKAAEAERLAALGAEKLEQDFGKGFGVFKFGQTPQEINPGTNVNLNWEVLPVAGEYKPADVRYFIAPLSACPTSQQFGHFSAKSYLCALFLKDRLFCVSLRFMDDTDVRDHTFVLNDFVAKYDLPKIDDHTYRYKEDHLQIAAVRNIGFTVIEIGDNPVLQNHTWGN